MDIGAYRRHTHVRVVVRFPPRRTSRWISRHTRFAPRPGRVPLASAKPPSQWMGCTALQGPSSIELVEDTNFPSGTYTGTQRKQLTSPQEVYTNGPLTLEFGYSCRRGNYPSQRQKANQVRAYVCCLPRPPRPTLLLPPQSPIRRAARSAACPTHTTPTHPPPPPPHRTAAASTPTLVATPTAYCSRSSTDTGRRVTRFRCFAGTFSRGASPRACRPAGPTPRPPCAPPSSRWAPTFVHTIGTVERDKRPRLGLNET